MTTNHIHTIKNKALSFVGLLLVMGLFVTLASNNAYAQQAPPAGSQIGNTASATYTDSGGNERTVTSNTVETSVQQVAGVSISDGVTKSVSPGGQVSFTHTITNNGNGSDSFDLEAEDVTGDNFDFGANNISIYADADGNGTPDDFDEITSTPNIDAGDSYGIVIVANIPSSVTQDDEAEIQVTATSAFDDDVSDTTDPNDKAVISEAAVIDVQKSVSQSTVDTGDQVTYTFTFSNNGNSDGSNLSITDALPDGVTYVTGSGVWSGSGSGLDDDDDSNPTGISYNYAPGTGDNGTITAIITSLPAGASGTLKFDVTVNENTHGQTIVNYGVFNHDALNNPANTNNATITVNQSYSVKVDDAIAANDDTVSVAAVDQGSTVNFVNKYTNNGTTTDTYNITLDNGNYPTGTTFTLYKADAGGNPTSPFTDTNGDGTPDTGPIAVNGSVTVILQVNLPSNATGEGPFTVDKTLTSVNDGSATATITDKLEGITSSSVDLTNYAATGDTDATGEDQGPEDNPVNTEGGEVPATNPGNTVDISLFVTNTSAIDDSYQLAAGNGVDGSDNLQIGGFPEGWSVTFRDPNNGNSQITSTGTLATGASKEITARVTIPADASPQTKSLYFRARSSSSGAVDIIHNAVTVNTYRNVSLTSNNTGQIFPGGSKTYPHTITVNSNVDENDGVNGNSDFKLKLENSAEAGFTAQVYYDANGNGIIETGGGDVLIASSADGEVDLSDEVTAIGTLTYGSQIKLIVKVNANTGVTDGSTNTTTLTLSDDVGPIGPLENEDISTVVAGLLSIEKFQAPDNGGTPNGWTKSDFNVSPGGIVHYKIVVSNDGAAAVEDVVVSDVIPSYTTLHVAGGADPVVINENDVVEDVKDDSGLVDGDVGTILVNVTELAPGESFEFTFSVEVDGGGQ